MESLDIRPKNSTDRVAQRQQEQSTHVQYMYYFIPFEASDPHLLPYNNNNLQKYLSKNNCGDCSTQTE